MVSINKKVASEIEEHINQAYSKWLMEYCPEDIHCKEDLITLEENGTYVDEFFKWVRKEVM